MLKLINNLIIFFQGGLIPLFLAVRRYVLKIHLFNFGVLLRRNTRHHSVHGLALRCEAMVVTEVANIIIEMVLIESVIFLFQQLILSGRFIVADQGNRHRSRLNPIALGCFISIH